MGMGEAVGVLGCKGGLGIGSGREGVRWSLIDEQVSVFQSIDTLQSFEIKRFLGEKANATSV